jgi:hypothetical protein
MQYDPIIDAVRMANGRERFPRISVNQLIFGGHVAQARIERHVYNRKMCAISHIRPIPHREDIIQGRAPRLLHDDRRLAGNAAAKQPCSIGHGNVIGIPNGIPVGVKQQVSRSVCD